MIDNSNYTRVEATGVLKILRTCLEGRLNFFICFCFLGVEHEILIKVELPP